MKENSFPEELNMFQDIDPLPTTPEIARSGAQEYQQVVDLIRDERLREDLFSAFHVRTCFTGLTPESKDFLTRAGGYGINTLNPKWRQYLESDLSTFQNTVGQVTDNYLFINQSIVNMRAAHHVMVNNPEYFPREAIKSPKTWLEENYLEWYEWGDGGGKDRTANIRYGLLSGFPKSSVEMFWDYHLLSGFVKSIFDTPDDLHAYEGINDLLKNESFLNRLNQIGLHLPEDFIQRLMRRDVMIFETLPAQGFISFYPEQDRKFLRALEKIHHQSGIEVVVQSYQGE